MRVVLRRLALAATGALTLVLSPAAPATAHEHQKTSDPPAEVPASGKITVVAKEFKFSPGAIQVKKGQHVTIVFKNEGRLSHNLTIPDLGLHTSTIQSGAQATIEFTAKQTGTHAFWCAVPGHKQAGMIGKVDVVK
jgi:uncharacterized cupredoxin-like copper-binding protein